MTHTLHRVGEPGSLERDYVLLFMPSKDINHVDSGPKLRKMLEISLQCGAVKIGDCRHGNEYYQGGLDKVLENVEDRAVVTAVFDNPDNVVEALKELKDADFGISVVVSGLFERVRECCGEAKLTPHTVNNHAGPLGSDGSPSSDGDPGDQHHVRTRHGGRQADRRGCRRSEEGGIDPGKGRRTSVQAMHVRHFQCFTRG